MNVGFILKNKEQSEFKPRRKWLKTDVRSVFKVWSAEPWYHIQTFLMTLKYNFDREAVENWTAAEMKDKMMQPKSWYEIMLNDWWACGIQGWAHASARGSQISFKTQSMKNIIHLFPLWTVRRWEVIPACTRGKKESPLYVRAAVCNTVSISSWKSVESLTGAPLQT